MIAAFFARYALVGLAALLALALAAAGVQSYRLKSLQASIDEDRADAVQAVHDQYEAQLATYNEASAALVITQRERDEALKAAGRKVIQYVRLPGAAVQCLDDDGLRIVADLASGTSTSAGAPAGVVPERAAGAD